MGQLPENVLKIQKDLPKEEDSSVFKPGDIVVLKSGSPPMTVRTVTVGGKKLPTYIKVNWFSDSEDMSADFLTEQLLHIEDALELDATDMDEENNDEQTAH